MSVDFILHTLTSHAEGRGLATDRNSSRVLMLRAERDSATRTRNISLLLSLPRKAVSIGHTYLLLELTARIVDPRRRCCRCQPRVLLLFPTARPPFAFQL